MKSGKLKIPMNETMKNNFFVFCISLQLFGIERNCILNFVILIKK